MRIYLDHNASCPLRAVARHALNGALSAAPGNPSSAHAEGRAARRLLEQARAECAALLAAEPDEIVFTSGGSESNAMALGLAPPRSRVACADIEHPSILAPLEARAAAGGRRRLRLAVDAAGLIDPAALHDPGQPAPALVVFGLANHELGTLQDASALVAAARGCRARVHVDASQAAGRVPLDFRALGADTLTVSAHKFGGPVGLGLLVVRRGVDLPPLLAGGSQQDGRRAGTEPVALAVAAAAALREALAELPQAAPRWRDWVRRLHAAICAIEPQVQCNSPATGGLPNTLNLSFPGRRGASLVHRLDLEGVACSHGSACASGSLQPSPVLLAIGASEERARGALRFSVGPANVEADLDRFPAALSAALRAPGASTLTDSSEAR